MMNGMASLEEAKSRLSACDPTDEEQGANATAEFGRREHQQRSISATNGRPTNCILMVLESSWNPIAAVSSILGRGRLGSTAAAAMMTMACGIRVRTCCPVKIMYYCSRRMESTGLKKSLTQSILFLSK